MPVTEDLKLSWYDTQNIHLCTVKDFENLTKDIAYGLNTSLENAEFIKCKNGVAKESLADEQKIIKIIGTNGREDKEISEKYLASIIQPRVNEIFNLAKNEVERSDYNGDFTFGIISSFETSNYLEKIISSIRNLNIPGYEIIIVGARDNNLNNVNVNLPRNKLIVITGLSGSGKSTLAFDTIYSEGQRRYVESLSTYARRFLSMMEKPDVDQIEGLSPAISIEQKSTSHNPRSTVGTVTEIYDYLRLLYSRIGTPVRSKVSST